MKRFSLLCAFSALVLSGVAHANINWVNKNIAQDTDPTQGTFVTMLVPQEFGDQSRAAYLCRENDRSDGLTNVGKAIVIKGQPISTAVCYLPWRGKEYKRTDNFDLLRIWGNDPRFGRKGFEWVEPGSKYNPTVDLHLDSYAFGINSNGGHPIYACLDKRTGTLGKLLYPHPDFKVALCFVPMGGIEHQVVAPDYLILKKTYN